MRSQFSKYNQKYLKYYQPEVISTQPKGPILTGPCAVRACIPVVQQPFGASQNLMHCQMQPVQRWKWQVVTAMQQHISKMLWHWEVSVQGEWWHTGWVVDRKWKNKVVRWKIQVRTRVKWESFKVGIGAAITGSGSTNILFLLPPSVHLYGFTQSCTSQWSMVQVWRDQLGHVGKEVRKCSLRN